MATIKKASVSKAKSGTSLGMKSVKAGFDKNPSVTRADIIVAGKGQAKKGKMVKKAQNGIREYNRQRAKGSDPLTEYYPKIKRGSGNLIPVGVTKNPKTGDSLKPVKQKMGGMTSKKAMYGSTTMKSGGKMGKCKYGCK